MKSRNNPAAVLDPALLARLLRCSRSGKTERRTMEDEVFDGGHNFSCTEEDMGPRQDSLYIIVPVIAVYVVIFFTGTIGNISTCIVISRNKSMHTATNYYLFSLAISDLVLLLSGLPQEIYLIYSRYPYIFGSAFCFLRGMLAETSANATVLTITAFTVERYLAICHPFLSHTMSKLSRAVKLILGIWLVAVGLAVPQAMQFRIEGTPDCEMCSYKPWIEHSFELSTFLFFVLPMSLISVLYVLIGQKLRSSTMMKKRNAFGNANQRVQSKSSRKVVKMLVAVVVAFFICWAPFHAQRLYSKYSPLTQMTDEERSFYLKIYEIVTYTSGILYYMSATINPILYNIMSVKFREAFKETFARCCGLGHFKASRPQRSYSVLSRSAQRGQDSTDSGRDDPTLHSHTSITQKSSIDSFNGGVHPALRRNKTFSTFRGAGIEEETVNWPKEISEANLASKAPFDSPNKLISIQLNPPQPPRKLNKFWQYFECIAKRTFDDGKRLSAYYASPVKEPSILLELESTPKKQQGRCTSPCDISNSSLKDVESGAIEDELTTYMKEVRRRECYS